jgi:polar amino acid transport system ATP-binding protein
MQSTHLLLINKLSAELAGSTILQGVSFGLKRGEIVALLGKSGAGKSTFLRVIAAQQSFSSGQVICNGRIFIDAGVPRYPLTEIRRTILMVQQSQCLLPHLCVRDNIALGLIVVLRLSRSEAYARTKRIMEGFGIGELQLRYPRELSGGQAQRAQLARAVVMEPSILLLDEVTSSLDSQTAEEIMNSLRRVHFEGAKEQGIVFVTHQEDLAHRFADRILYLEDGNLTEYAADRYSAHIGYR